MEKFDAEFRGFVETFNEVLEESTSDEFDGYASIATNYNVVVSHMESGQFGRWVDENVDVLPKSFEEYVDIVDAYVEKGR